MKTMKKIFALVLVLTVVLALGSMAFAADGQGTLTISNATKGQTYTAYKVFNAVYENPASTANPISGVTYTVPAANESLITESSPFQLSASKASNGETIVVRKTDATDAQIIDWIKNNYASFDATGTALSFDATNSTASATLPYGYYYVTSSLGTVVTIDSVNDAVSVFDKNTVAPVDPVKTIVSVDGVAQNEVTQANAHVGSVVGFKVTAKTTNWDGTDYTKETLRQSWTLTDTPTNMTIDLNSVVVKFNGTELAADAYTAAISNGALTINVPMVDANGNSIYEATVANGGLIPIEVTYSATIDAAAASAPAKNEIPGDNPPPPVVVNTYAFQIAKTDGTKPLAGAQFELWYNNAALTFIDNGDGTYTYSPTGTVTTLDMTTNTTIVVKGLDNSWNYTLKETKVPNGYNQAADIPVAGSSLTKVEEITTAGDGTTTTTKLTDTSVTSTELYKETVINNQGTELPSTGGIGTTIFYVVGGILVLGALVFLVTKKRVTE